MKIVLSTFVVFYLFCFFMPQVLCAEGVVAGGYDVARIAGATLNVLKEKKILSESSFNNLEKLLTPDSKNPLASSSSIIDLYDKIGTYLVEKGIASQEDITAAKTAAAQSGGIKIGGYNPVILSASFLNILVKKNIISLSEAQSILDGAKIAQ